MEGFSEGFWLLRGGQESLCNGVSLKQGCEEWGRNANKGKCRAPQDHGVVGCAWRVEGPVGWPGLWGCVEL